MGLFSSKDEERITCNEDSPHADHHDGSLEETDEQWIGRFKPIKQDDEYIYGYREQANYYRCTECDKLLHHPYYEPVDEFVKVPKGEVPVENLEELEVALEEVRYMAGT